jgi:hypothetical protein
LHVLVIDEGAGKLDDHIICQTDVGRGTIVEMFLPEFVEAERDGTK